MISMKAGVKLAGLQPQIVLGVIIANDVIRSLGYNCVITSGSEGRHQDGSLHYEGLALDLRTVNIPKPEWDGTVTAIKSALGPDFDVVLEATHIHLEYQDHDNPPETVTV